MKKLLATTLAITAVLFASAASAQSVRGESLDSGLGALPSSYTGKEFMQLSASHVAGEKQDSGLGSVSQEELRRIVSAYEASRQR
jgi:hypothetical protein